MKNNNKKCTDKSRIFYSIVLILFMKGFSPNNVELPLLYGARWGMCMNVKWSYRKES